MTGSRLTFHGGNRRQNGGSITRFIGTAKHADRAGATLRADHPAITKATTLFTKSVVNPKTSPRLLISGVNSAKLGAKVLVGPWRGMPIYQLTLVERETCPTHCDLWRACFGNAMPFARRHRYTPDLARILGAELEQKAADHPQGFVVRLHVLGDFPDLAYVQHWAVWMATIPELHVFGYTHHRDYSDIGALISAIGAFHPERWAIRFSVPPSQVQQPYQATTIWRQPEGPHVAEGFVCPAQRTRANGQHVAQACATCGACRHPSLAGERIVFVGHGMAKRGRKGKAHGEPVGRPQ